MITFFYDENRPYSCSDWGIQGDSAMPIIVNDGDFTDDGLDYMFFGIQEVSLNMFLLIKSLNYIIKNQVI